jgi:nucleoside-diphosphate-sugar epimerase
VGDLVILGAGGVVADELAKLLVSEKETVRLVSRSGRGLTGATAVTADVTAPGQAIAAVKGSSVVYLCVGLKYDAKIWARYWPRIMSNVIEACQQAGSKLVFFDNVYAYGRVDGAMTEATPFNPCSRKGEIRAKIATQLMDETKRGGLTALIARSADFYGPFADTTSVPNRLVFKPFAAGKKADWLVNDRVKHSYTFTLDIASALAALSRSDDAYNQAWHLPTAPDPLTGKEFIETAAQAFGVDVRYRVLSKSMIRLAGLFDKTVAESYEMLYQNEFPYIFDSSKFETSFRMGPTSYRDGIRKTAESYMARGSG